MTPADEMRSAATLVREDARYYAGAAEKIAAILDEAADRWDAEIATDDDALYHDGDESRAGCERPFLDGTTAPDRCVCFDKVLDAARAINSTKPQGAS